MQGIGLVGNLTDAPVISSTKSGKAVARFTLAVNDGYRTVDGTWTTRPAVFQRCESWNDAEAAKGWAKGALVVVVGSLRADTYEATGEDGATEQRRAQWFAADVAAAVPRVKTPGPPTSEPATEPAAAQTTTDAPDGPLSVAR